MSQVNLHNHSEGSFLDGYSGPDSIAKRSKECGHEYASITDHGECNQHLSFYKACQKEGIQPILGIEGYWLSSTALDAARTLKKRVSSEKSATDPEHYFSPSHICLLAQNNTGLRNLWALSSMAYSPEHFYYKPIATPDLLREYSEGLYASDGCMLTEFADKVEAGDEDGAKQIIGTLVDIFRDKFYMELHTWQYMDLPGIPDLPSGLVLTPDVEVSSLAEEIQKAITARDIIAEKHALNARMRDLNHAKIRLATEMGIPLVVVNDSHHAYPEHWINREYVWAFSTSSDNNDKLQAALGGMAQKADHIMGEDELYYWMGKHDVSRETIAEAIKNSYQIAQTCQVEINPTLTLPRTAPNTTEEFNLLLDACEEGFNKYVVGQGLDEDKYTQRLQEELTLISQRDFSGYFNIIHDCTKAYRSGAWKQYVTANAIKEPILLGPGRGSVGGSLVAYLLSIHMIDPLEYGTLFSRFISPGRKGLPDIDIDIPQSQRKAGLEYLPARFGEENVCVVGTIIRNGPKATVKDMGRALGITKLPNGYLDLQAISDHIKEVEGFKDPNNPDDEELTWSELIERKGGVLDPYRRKYPELFDQIEKMVHRVRGCGVHPSAVLVAGDPLLGSMPMRRTKEGKSATSRIITTQLDMYDVEEMGGAKLDWLGLRHLDTLTVARNLIYERHQVWIDYDRTGLSVPEGCPKVITLGREHFRDPEIWPQIDAGLTTGVFQVETSNCTQAAVEFKPRSEVDVADLTSIIRPGVADAGLKEVYLRRRAGLEPVVYDHPLMENFVGPGWSTNTYGILVYQEQIIQCVQEMAGFTADEADDLRKAVGKKLMDKLVLFKDKFVQGCLNNGDYFAECGFNPNKGTQIAHKIWLSIESAGRYAFNWSHAVEYAYIATWEVWVKHYYPQEFLVALMQTDSGNINKYIREARRREVKILPPDINLSGSKFTISGDTIRYGIDTVHGVGPAACRDIQAFRPYNSLTDYLRRSEEGADKGVATNLILIGAFDCFGSRPQMLKELQHFKATDKLAQSTLDNPEKLEAIVTRRLTDNPEKYRIEIPDFDDHEVLYNIEKTLIGTFVTVDPMERYLPLMQNVISDPLEILQKEKGEEFYIGGQVATVSPTVTKRGKNPGAHMAHITVSWNDAEFRVVSFPDTWPGAKSLLRVGAPVGLTVKKLDDGCCLVSVERLDVLMERQA